MIVAYYCECKGRGHKVGCVLQLRLEIKERVCRERGVTSYVSDDVADEIDIIVSEELMRRS